MKKALPFLIGAALLVGAAVVAHRMGWLKRSPSAPAVVVVPGEQRTSPAPSTSAGTNTNDVIAAGIQAFGSVAQEYLSSSSKTEQTQIWADSLSYEA